MNDNEAAAEKQLLKSQISALEQLLDVYEKSVLETTDELYIEIAKRKRIEEDMKQSEERYRTIIDEMEEWYFETDTEGSITFANDILADVLGYSKDELIGMSMFEFIKKDDSDAVLKLLSQAIKTGKVIRNFPYELNQTNGIILSAEISAFPKRNMEAKIIGLRGVGHDITERKNAEDRIQYLATHDNMTGLPNRLMFSQLLNHSLQSARHHKRNLAVFYLDLDHFKNINDTRGHAAGDQLLKEIAKRLIQTLRASDIACRIGGDEFVIMIEDANEISQAETVARKILDNTDKPFIIMGEECRITASIGIGVYPADGEDEQTLLKNADAAMYFAKEKGRNNYQFYSKDLGPQQTDALYEGTI